MSNIKIFLGKPKNKITTKIIINLGQIQQDLGPAPDYIEVVTLPTKTEYDDGDLIDFTGIVVKAFNEDGSVWENPKFPDGIIPVDKLTFPVTVAVYPND